MTVPERYLGLTMPHEQDNKQQETSPAESAKQTSEQQQHGFDAECAEVPAYLSRLAQHVSKHVDLDLLLDVAATVQHPGAPDLQQNQTAAQQEQAQLAASEVVAVAVLNQQPRPVHTCRIAVARDEAFCFYYQVGWLT